MPHGFRSSFRDWAAECSDAPREVCELALAHVNTNAIEAAYRADGPVRAAAGAHGAVGRVPGRTRRFVTSRRVPGSRVNCVSRVAYDPAVTGKADLPTRAMEVANLEGPVAGKAAEAGSQGRCPKPGRAVAHLAALGVLVVLGLAPDRSPAYDFYPPGGVSAAGAARWEASAFPLRLPDSRYRSLSGIRRSE